MVQVCTITVFEKAKGMLGVNNNFCQLETPFPIVDFLRVFPQPFTNLKFPVKTKRKATLRCCTCSLMSLTNVNEKVSYPWHQSLKNVLIGVFLRGISTYSILKNKSAQVNVKSLGGAGRLR